MDQIGSAGFCSDIAVSHFIAGECNYVDPYPILGDPANRILKERDRAIDDPRRPVWSEATESFYKELNRIAKQCDLARYDALSRGLDALRREAEVLNSGSNRNTRSQPSSKLRSQIYIRHGPGWNITSAVTCTIPVKLGL